MISADQTTKRLEECKSEGAAAFIFKPFQKEELKTILAQVIE